MAMRIVVARVFKRQQVAFCHSTVFRTFWRNFASNEDDSTEWIPPDRPLVGDKGQSHLYIEVDDEDEIRRIEEELRKLEDGEATTEPAQQISPLSVDWLTTRRTALASDMTLPSEAAAKKQELSDIPVKVRTLLTKNEITTCLDALGGRDIVVVLDDPTNQRWGDAIGRILVTGSGNTHLRMLADTLVRQMRLRDLHKYGIVGAELGPEGSKDPNESWFVVDCGNYVVHLLEEKTRTALNLEYLWTGKDKLYTLNSLDENAVDEYVAANPVPEDYGLPSSQFDETLKQLEKSRWSIPHRPVIRKIKRKKSKR